MHIGNSKFYRLVGRDAQVRVGMAGIRRRFWGRLPICTQEVKNYTLNATTVQYGFKEYILLVVYLYIMP